MRFLWLTFIVIITVVNAYAAHINEANGWAAVAGIVLFGIELKADLDYVAKN